MELLVRALLAFNVVVIVYFVLLNVFYLGTTLLAFFALRRYAVRMKSLDVDDLVTSAGAPPITLLVPAFDEEATLVSAIQSFLTLSYPAYEIIVCNDGSTDRTLELLQETYALIPSDRVPTEDLATETIRGIYQSHTYPNLFVIDKENGGKADALNAALKYCRTPLVCGLDADTLLERDALIRIVRPFLEDGSTVAAGGILRIANGCEVHDGQVTRVRLPRTLLPRFQVLEYLRAFLSGRMGWDSLGASLIISGAFGAFRRDVVAAAGGYSTNTVGEDMELVVRVHRYCLDQDRPYRIAFVPDPVAWTECPEQLPALGRQRDRWQRGLVQSILRHVGMLFNPAYKRVGLVAMPYFFFLEMLGPVIEFLGYVAFVLSIILGIASLEYVITFLLVAVVFGVVLSVAAVGLEELTFRRYPRARDLLSLFGLAFIENLGYRQLIAWWRFRGVMSALFRRRSWGRQRREGFGDTAARGRSTTRPGVALPTSGAVVALAVLGAAPLDAQLPHEFRNRLGGEVEFTWFDERDPWQLISLEYLRRGTPGVLVARVNYANRFDLSGLQYEVDVYPLIGERAYAYLNYGYSSDALFPEHRVGGEYFQGLPGGWEVSAGVRHLRFDESVTLYTGSIGKYWGNNWLSFRPWVRSLDGELSTSGRLSYRHFGPAGREDYWQVSVGTGSSVTEIQAPLDLERLRSWTADVERRFPIIDNMWLGLLSFGWEWEELTGDRTQNRFRVRFGIAHNFGGAVGSDG